MSARRLFFALWPDRAARAALLRLAREVAHAGQGRVARESNLHVTLAFLGQVEADRVPAVRDAGAQAAAAVAPFALALERLGGSGYGIAWVMPDGIPPALRDLHEALAGALDDAGFTREQRMFRPHLTLARDCSRRVQQGAVAPIGWQVGRLALVASTLAPGGSQYETVAEWPLAAPGQSTGTV